MTRALKRALGSWPVLGCAYRARSSFFIRHLKRGAFQAPTKSCEAQGTGLAMGGVRARAVGGELTACLPSAYHGTCTVMAGFQSPAQRPLLKPQTKQADS